MIPEGLLRIVFATREPGNYKLESLKPLIAYGASPRGSITLALAAKAHAMIEGRGYVTPEDIKQIAYDVLRHRILVSYEAEAEDITSEEILRRILAEIPVP